MKMTPSIIESCKKQIGNSEKIVITTHVNPDGDAIGSALGLWSILAQAGKSSTVIVPNEYPEFLKWMDGSDEVMVFESQKEKATDIVEGADLVFHLDYNALKRSGPMHEVLTGIKADRITIDHHQQPEDFGGILISDPEMSSTCEMIFHFALNLEMEDQISKAGAECLYTGLITDTGNFRFSSTSPHTLRVAARLLEVGVKPHEIASRVYDINTENRLGLLSRALEKMEVLHEYRAVLMNLSSDDLETFHYEKGDTEGFVNYGLSVKDVVLSVFVSEKSDVVKLSFRSKGEFDVNTMAREHFNGGGHVNAAGAVSELSLEETIKKLKALIPQYAEKLQNAG